MKLHDIASLIGIDLRPPIKAQAIVDCANAVENITGSAYLDLIAPDESPWMREQMGKMSGCALVAAGILRNAGVRDSKRRLAAPYKVGSAVSRLCQLADDLGATVPLGKPIFPGDVLLIGYPEHVLTVVDMAEDWIESIDGGQGSGQGVLRKHRLLAKGMLGNRKLLRILRFGVVNP